MKHNQNNFAPEAASDDDVSPVDRQPGDRLAFEPVALRRRSDGLTPEKQRDYVEALADTGVAREAAARIGVTEQSVARVRRRPDARSFDRACEAAHRMGAGRLRAVAYERAIEGTVKGRYYHGELKSEETVYDNRLLIYLLGKTEHLLDPPEESRAICENWEPFMDALEQGLPPPELKEPAPDPERDQRPRFDPRDFESTGDEVWEEDGIWWTEFPPPEGFDGDEQGEYGDDDYQRTLTAREQAVVDWDNEAEAAETLAEDCARRDRFFGFAEEEEISSPREAEPSEPSEPSGQSPSCTEGGEPVEQTLESDITRSPAYSEGGSG